MRYEKRTNKKGTDIYYSFIRYDKGKQRRMTRQQIRDRFGKNVTTEDEAKKCLGLLEAEQESEKVRVKKRLQWKERYFRFGELLDMYVRKQKKKAPNSWKNGYHYLSHYTLPYFLHEDRKLNNVATWHNYFDDFREYLEKEAKLVRTGELLSYGSKNHAIKSLNTFLRYCYQDGEIDHLRLCEYFEDHLLTQRTIDDVVTEEEFQKVEVKLLDNGHKLEADFFRFLYFTGMRLNEAAGISLADVYPGKINKKAFENRLKANDIKYQGYLLLMSQPAGQNRTIRDRKTMKVTRKPLKGRRLISEKHCRIIPITDHYLWSNLMERMRTQYEKLKNGAYGSNSSDYLLFDGFNRTTSLKRVKETYKKLNFKEKTWHCLRHTRGTQLFGETGDRELAKMWLGHGSDKVFERYNHTYEELARSKKRTGLKKDEHFDDWFFSQEDKPKFNPQDFPMYKNWQRVVF